MSAKRWFFGFGSLVNDDTLPPDTVWQPANLQNWRRAWGHAIPTDPTWFALDARPAPGTSMAGLLIEESDSLAPILAQRERGYSAHELNAADLDITLAPGDSAWIWISQSPAESGQAGCLLQSYVDCVLAGFLRHFGEIGMAQFMDSTSGWQHPIIADRGTPRYPRAVTLSAEARQLIDHRVSEAQQRTRQHRGD